MNQPEPRRNRVHLYAAAIVVGVILIAVGIVAGGILKDIPVAATVGTTVPGIGSFLYGIRGYGQEEV